MRTSISLLVCPLMPRPTKPYFLISSFNRLNVIGSRAEQHFVRTWVGYPVVFVSVEVAEHVIGKCEEQLFLVAGFERHFLERLEFLDRTDDAGFFGRYIELYNLLPGTRTGVLDGYAD